MLDRCCAGCRAARCGFLHALGAALGLADLCRCRRPTGGACAPTPRRPASAPRRARAGDRRGRPHGGRAAVAVAAAGRRADLRAALRWEGAELIDAALARGPRPRAPDAAPGLLRGHARRPMPSASARVSRSRCCTARRARPGCASWRTTARARPGPGHRAGHAGRRAPDDPRAAARRDRRPAARPGAARRHGRVGAVLRHAGLHDDAGRAPGRSRPARRRC